MTVKVATGEASRFYDAAPLLNRESKHYRGHLTEIKSTHFYLFFVCFHSIFIFSVIDF